MKKLGLLFHFYHKSIFNLFLITAVMTVACFSILYTVGRVNYISHTKQIFEELVSNNSYCIQFGTFSEYNSEDIALYKEEYQKLVNELKSNSQIDKIDYMQHTDSLECNGENVVVFLYSDSLWEKFLALPKGDNAVSTNKDDTFFGVISGSNLDDIKDGDNLVIRSHFGNSKEKISNFFAGSHVQYPYYIPTFLTSGNNLSTNDFISSGNFIIIRETKEAVTQLQKISPIYPGVSFFITFREDTPLTEKTAILQDLESRLFVEPISTIQKNTDIRIKQSLSKALPLPIFLVTVSTASFLSLSVLLLHKKEKEFAIYYLCGISKFRSFLLMLYALGIPAFLTAFFNVLFLLLYPMLSQRSVIKFYEVLFDNTSIIVILFYLVCMIIICTLLSLSRLINKSEIEIFRRN